MQSTDLHYIDLKEKNRIRLIIDGDKQAFADIFHEYHKTIYFIVLKYLKDESLAEDALQEIFLKIWVNRALINPDLSFKSYLYAVAKNHVLNLLRTDALVAEKIMDYSARLDHRIDPEEFEKTIEISEVLRNAIESLPKKRRVIVKLKVYKNSSNLQVATRLNISVNTVKVQYNLARKQLRAYFNL
jgi:RNA polymerase sigma-70 factor (family 1)